MVPEFLKKKIYSTPRNKVIVSGFHGFNINNMPRLNFNVHKHVKPKVIDMHFLSLSTSLSYFEAT